MQITIVAVLCHLLGSLPVCHEEIVVEDKTNVRACIAIPTPVLMRWKARSKFRSKDWHLVAMKCVLGDYIIRNEA